MWNLQEMRIIYTNIAQTAQTNDDLIFGQQQYEY